MRSSLKRVLERFNGSTAVDSTHNEDCLFNHKPFTGGNLEHWIREGIHGYRQWYQCVDFGNNLIAHVTRPPEWLPAPEFDESSGIERWKLNVARNLPNLEGKRVLDLGCNVGLFSLEMARMGASRVIGVDRDADVEHRTGGLPRQDIVSQADFVREAFSYLKRENLPVEYLAVDICDTNSIKGLGKFDVIVALNIVYHTLDIMPSLLKVLSQMTDHLILQASQGHSGPVGYWAKLETHIEILSKLDFTNIDIDLPKGNLQPVIVATR